HRIVEAIEMADGAELVTRNAAQLELDAREEAERSFRADQQLGQVLSPLAQRIEVVAPHPAQELWHAQSDLFGIVGVERAHGLRQLRELPGRAAQVIRQLAEHDAR